MVFGQLIHVMSLNRITFTSVIVKVKSSFNLFKFFKVVHIKRFVISELHHNVDIKCISGSFKNEN